ncbi:MAG: patatin-like phospholipase family protein [Phormidesmis sp.]
MPRRSRDQHLFDAGPKRILALDGGGVRGIFTLQILKKIEAIVRQRTGDETACLADYFDLIGGTSTGSIIAAGLARGWQVDRLDQLYRQLGGVIFKSNWLRWGPLRVLRPKFSAQPLRQVLCEEFGDTTLGDRTICTGLAIVTKRLDTGSPWVIFNNPKAPFFEQPADGSIPNQHYYLRDIIRASTAAPSFFQPERIKISDDVEGAFVDGGVSPHNNPALQLLLLAILDGYKLSWPTGVDNLLVVSVGTGFKAMKKSTDKVMRMRALPLALGALQSLMDDTSHLNELLLQMVSQSPTAREIDSEVGTGAATASNLSPLISYLRYDVALEGQWLQQHLGLELTDARVKTLWEMDDPKTMNLLSDIGTLAAEKLLKDAHFLSAFDIT